MTPEHHDERFFYAAMYELMGKDFVLDANITLAILSQIAQRAAELKHAERAERAATMMRAQGESPR